MISSIILKKLLTQKCHAASASSETAQHQTCLTTKPTKICHIMLVHQCAVLFSVRLKGLGHKYQPRTGSYTVMFSERTFHFSQVFLVRASLCQPKRLLRNSQQLQLQWGMQMQIWKPVLTTWGGSRDVPLETFVPVVNDLMLLNEVIVKRRVCQCVWEAVAKL